MIKLHAIYSFGTGGNGVALLGGGWAAPEAGFVWSVGRESRLRVPAPRDPAQTVVELEIEPFVARPHVRKQQIRLAVNGAVVGERRIGGKFIWRIALANDDAASDNIDICLTRDPATPAPARLGIADVRDLGFKLSELKILAVRQAPPPPRVRAMTEFRFGCNEPTGGLLEAGWGRPEGGFVWAIGPTSTLRLPRRDAPAEALLLLDMRPVTGPDGAARQRVCIGVNGRLLRYVQLRDRCILALPVDLPPRAGWVEVRFDNLDAFAHPGHALHASGLPLAWALASIRLAPRQPDLPPSVLPPVPGDWHDGTLAHAARARAGIALPDLVTRFESIAGSCRLGNLQRRLDHDPVSLLRYAAMPQRELVEAILAGFADVGRPDALKWDVRGPEDTTWRLIDLVFRISFATPYPLAAAPPQDMFATFGKTLPWQAEKLMRDIAAAEKIFQARLLYEDDEAVALAVLTALRQFGEARLLYIDDSGRKAPGSVERLACGLLRGHLDARQDADPDQADASLVSILANAWALSQ